MLTRASKSLQFITPHFEGPLDLLLHLIREHKIDIHDIPIAQITGQYLDYLARMEELDLAIAGEYLVMAATLVQIKSQILLPAPPPPEGEEEEDPRMELVQRLLEYQQYQNPVETLRSWEEFRREIYFRGALENPEDYLLPISQSDVKADALLAALRRVLESSGVDATPVTSVVPRRSVNLRMKMAELIRHLRSHPEGSAFEALFEFPCYRADVVMTFLALLELLRQRRARFEQGDSFGEILLYPREPEEE